MGQALTRPYSSQLDPFGILYAESLSFHTQKKKKKEGVQAIRAVKYKIMWLENILAPAHLWRGSTFTVLPNEPFFKSSQQFFSPK